MVVFKKTNLKWFVGGLVILAVTFYTYSIELLTDRGYKPPQIMVFRGSLAFIFCTVISLVRGYSLLPNVWKPQIFRFFINGIASYLVIVSFKYLSASTIALINRLDVPFLIFLSALSGHQKSNLQFWLSVWTVLIIAFLAIDARFIDEETIGFVYAFIGVLFISMGYFLVKHSSKNENAYLICNIFSLSNIVIGLILLLYKGYSLTIHVKDLWIFLLSALSQVGLYTLAIMLYRWFDIEKARLPFVLATLTTMIIEMLFEHKVFGISQMGLSLLLTGMLITIILNPATPVRQLKGLKKMTPLITRRKKNGM